MDKREKSSCNLSKDLEVITNVSVLNVVVAKNDRSLDERVTVLRHDRAKEHPTRFYSGILIFFVIIILLSNIVLRIAEIEI